MGKETEDKELESTIQSSEEQIKQDKQEEKPDSEESIGEDALGLIDDRDVLEADAAPIEGEPVQEPIDEPQPVLVQKKGGAGAMILGGAIAAALGFGAAVYLEQGAAIFPKSKANEAFRAEATQKLDGLDKTVADLGSQIKMNSDKVGSITSQLSQGPDLDALSKSLDTLNKRADQLEMAINDLNARFSDLTQEAVNSALSKEVVDGYQKELVDLQASLKAQREQVESMVAEAQAKEQEVAAISQNTLTRAALTRVDTALQSGRPYQAALAEYEAVIGTSAPEALAQFAETGLVPLTELNETFVEHARAALNAARQDGSETVGTSRLGSFLKSQLQARSVIPKEGADSDAVLSRAEAALKDSRLGDALAELNTLPAAAKAEMEPWIATASARQDALTTIETLLSATN